jgi:hypothetical protein
MKLSRTCRALVLLAAAAAATVAPGVRAQEVPVVPIDCGPFRVAPGDLVHVNVGNGGPAAEELVIVHAGLMDQDGALLGERNITLQPGQSRSLSVSVPGGGLVRARVRVVTGPESPQLRATMQSTRQTRLRLTYGPIVECAGPTASRGPV